MPEPDAGLFGHAQEFETSFALARFPENIDHDAMAEQADQAPSLATSELGEEMLSRVIDRVSDFVSEMMDGSRSQPVPPFHP